MAGDLDFETSSLCCDVWALLPTRRLVYGCSTAGVRVVVCLHVSLLQIGGCMLETTCVDHGWPFQVSVIRIHLFKPRTPTL